MISSTATMRIVTSSSVKSAPSNALVTSAPNAGPPVTWSARPGGASAATAPRRSLMMSAVSALSAPTVIGATITAAFPSSLAFGPDDSRPVWASRTGTIACSAVMSARERSAASAREATTSTDCSSAFGNSSSSALTCDDSESGGAVSFPVGPSIRLKSPNRATKVRRTMPRDIQAPRRDVSRSGRRGRVAVMHPAHQRGPIPTSLERLIMRSGHLARTRRCVQPVS